MPESNPRHDRGHSTLNARNAEERELLANDASVASIRGAGSNSDLRVE